MKCAVKKKTLGQKKQKNKNTLVFLACLIKKYLKIISL